MLESLLKLLDQRGIEYELIHHRPDFRARATAADTGTPPVEFAKTLVVRVDGELALAVLPATHALAISRFAESLDANDVHLVAEWEMKDLFPGAEVGALPPVGNSSDLPVYVCPVLTRDERITFNAGTHTDAVRIAYADFERLAKPRVVAMSRHEDALVRPTDAGRRSGSMQLDLSADECSLLERVVESALSEMRVEVRHTENAEFRKGLEGDKEQLGSLLERLRRIERAVHE